MIAASSASAIPAYTVTARVLHWLIAALVLPMIALGIIIANEWGGPVQQPLYDLHKSIGALLLPLVLVRLVYRLMHPPPPLPADIPALQQFAAHATHWTLYALLHRAAGGRLGCHLGLSGAAADVRPVRAAACLAREPSALRAALRSAPLAGDRHRRGGRDPYRRGASAPFRAQGPGSHAHAHRLIPASRVMARPPSVRSVGELTSPEVSQCLQATSILCLPIGAIEQHGAHLPLDTDVVVAEELTRRIVARWGDELDLWQLPTVSISLSREHDWAPGTLSLSIQNFVALAAGACPQHRACAAGPQPRDRQWSWGKSRRVGQPHPRAARRFRAQCLRHPSLRSRQGRRECDQSPMFMAARARPR